MRSFSRLIRLCLEKQVPFVSFRLPGAAIYHSWIQRSGSMQFFESFDQVGKDSGFVYAPFHRNTNFPIVFLNGEIRIRGEEIDPSLLMDLEAMKPLYKTTEPILPQAITKSVYLRQANEFIKAFGTSLLKAVLSRVILQKKPEEFEVEEFFDSISTAYPEAFVHLIHMPGIGLWMGATPELLFHREEDVCFTEALAGTQSYKGGKEPQWKEKETEEQEMVAGYIQSLMQMDGILSYVRKEPETVRAGNLLHRKTGFRFTSAPMFDEAAFIRALHPTPAVCGLPKREALDLILRTEIHNREFYAGFCGPVNLSNTTRLYVNLRCMRIFDDHLAIYAGGGLTAKSHPQNEWEETELKARMLLSMI